MTVIAFWNVPLSTFFHPLDHNIVLRPNINLLFCFKKPEDERFPKTYLDKPDDTVGLLLAPTSKKNTANAAY